VLRLSGSGSEVTRGKTPPAWLHLGESAHAVAIDGAAQRGRKPSTQIGSIELGVSRHPAPPS
jgi:hypothetical protein